MRPGTQHEGPRGVLMYMVTERRELARDGAGEFVGDLFQCHALRLIRMADRKSVV